MATRLKAAKTSRSPPMEMLLFSSTATTIYLIGAWAPKAQAKGLVGKVPGNPGTCPQEPCNSDPQHVLHALKWTSLAFGLILISPILFYLGDKLFKKIWYFCSCTWRRDKGKASPSSSTDSIPTVEFSSKSMKGQDSRLSRKQNNSTSSNKSNKVNAANKNLEANFINGGKFISRGDNQMHSDLTSAADDMSHSMKQQQQQQLVQEGRKRRSNSKPAATNPNSRKSIQMLEQQQYRAQNSNEQQKKESSPQFGHRMSTTSTTKNRQRSDLNEHNEENINNLSSSPQAPWTTGVSDTMKFNAQRQLDERQQYTMSGTDFVTQHTNSFRRSRNDESQVEQQTSNSGRASRGSNYGEDTPSPYHANLPKHRHSLFVNNTAGQFNNQQQQSPSNAQRHKNSITPDSSTRQRKFSLKNNRPGSGRRVMHRVRPVEDNHQNYEGDQPNKYNEFPDQIRSNDEGTDEFDLDNDDGIGNTYTRVAQRSNGGSVSSSQSNKFVGSNPSDSNQYAAPMQNNQRSAFVSDLYQQQENSCLTVPSLGPQHRHSIDGSILNNMVHSFQRQQASVGQNSVKDERNQVNSRSVPGDTMNGSNNFARPQIETSGRSHAHIEPPLEPFELPSIKQKDGQQTSGRQRANSNKRQAQHDLQQLELIRNHQRQLEEYQNSSFNDNDDCDQQYVNDNLKPLASYRNEISRIEQMQNQHQSGNNNNQHYQHQNRNRMHCVQTTPFGTLASDDLTGPNSNNLLLMPSQGHNRDRRPSLNAAILRRAA